MGLTLTALNGARTATEVGRVMTDTNQNVRAGLNFLVRDLVRAGNGVPIGGVPLPSGTGSTPVNRPGPVAGTRFTDEALLHAVTPGSSLGPTISSQPTDLINILFTDRTVELDTFPLASVNSRGASVTVDARIPLSTLSPPIQAGDLILFSNARGNAVQMVTGVSNQQINFDANDPMNLNQRNATAGSITQLGDNGVFPPTTITRVILATYYLDAVTNPDEPRLVRRENMGPASAIALMVDNFQLAFDISDGSDTLNPAMINLAALPAGTSPAQLRKVNVFLAARPEETRSRSQSGFHAHLSTQVSLRSLALTDRYR
jgi:hypothetical protein